MRTTIWGVPTKVSSTGVDCPLRFPGQIHDAETGASYNYHRYYDPDTARYQSTDPLGLDAGPNPRAYVLNPILEIDPLGLVPCPIQAIKSLGHKIARGNNFIRIGRVTAGTPIRISLGPAHKHFNKLSAIGKALSPVHLHLELRKVGIDFNWFGKSFYKKW